MKIKLVVVIFVLSVFMFVNIIYSEQPAMANNIHVELKKGGLIFNFNDISNFKIESLYFQDVQKKDDDYIHEGYYSFRFSNNDLGKEKSVFFLVNKYSARTKIKTNLFYGLDIFTTKGVFRGYFTIMNINSLDIEAIDFDEPLEDYYILNCNFWNKKESIQNPNLRKAKQGLIFDIKHDEPSVIKTIIIKELVKIKTIEKWLYVQKFENDIINPEETINFELSAKYPKLKTNTYYAYIIKTSTKNLKGIFILENKFEPSSVLDINWKKDYDKIRIFNTDLVK